MKKESIYISIPITGHDESVQRTKAGQIATMLQKDGHSTINPFDLADRLKTILEREPTYNEYLDYDLLVLRSCDAIYMCEGWEQSYGCRKEHSQAEYQRIKIIYE